MESLDLFSTPILTMRLPDMAGVNAAFLDWVQHRRTVDPTGIQRSNLNGWHSVPDLAIRKGEPCAPLLDRVVAVTRELLRAHYRRVTDAVPPLELAVQAWVMVLGRGGFVAPHDHAGAHWSGVYYATAGDGETGALSFLHPVSGVVNVPGLPADPCEFSIQPEPGLLVVFPAWLRHYVQPYQGTSLRVSLSFNATLRPE